MLNTLFKLGVVSLSLEVDLIGGIMSFQKKLGIESGNIKPTGTKDERMKYINFKLAAMGLPPYAQNAKKIGRASCRERV